jgi:predicted ATPase
MIRSITVDNFKGIKHASLMLPKFGLIIGKNGSGKSTLLKAISLTQKLARGDDLAEALKGIAPLTSELFHFNSDSSNSTIELLIEASRNTIFKFIYSLTVDSTTKKLIVYSEELHRMVDENNSVIIYKRTDDKVVTYSNNTESTVPVKTEAGKLSLQGYSIPEIVEVAGILSNYTIVDNPERIEGLNVVSGDRPNLETLDGVVVSLFSKNQQAFNEAVLATQQIIPDFDPPKIRDLTKFYSDNSIPMEPLNQNINQPANPMDNAIANLNQNIVQTENSNKPSQNEGLKSYIVSWSEKKYSKSYTSISLSGGNLRTIYLIFSLFNTSGYSFFGVEEIENGMHSDRIARLIDQFRTQSNNKKIQMLFTTHSLELMNYVLPQEMIYCTTSPQTGSNYRRISDMEEYTLIKDELGKKHLTGADLIKSGLFS